MVTTPGTPDIRLCDQHSPRAADLLRELRDSVMRPSFRPEEYLSPEVIKPGSRPAIIACAEDGLVIGGALGHLSPASGVLLLSYLAVRRGFRGKGVGGVIMGALRENWLSPGTLALLEMDDPRYHAPHPDYGDPGARLRFYGAIGVRLLAACSGPEINLVRTEDFGAIPAGADMTDPYPIRSRWHLQGGEFSAVSRERTTATADMPVEVRGLGVAGLGGTRLGSLARTTEDSRTGS